MESLFGKTRRSILILLFSHADEPFHLRKILRLAGVAPGAGQRELGRLSSAGIILRTVKDNQVLFQANIKNPVFNELRGLVIRTAGVADALRDALEPLGARMSISLLYGSVARGEAGKESDVDLLVVGDVGFEDVINKVAKAQIALRREINLLVMSFAEFRDRLYKRDHLINSILKSAYIPIVGDVHDLVRMAKKRMAH